MQKGVHENTEWARDDDGDVMMMMVMMVMMTQNEKEKHSASVNAKRIFYEMCLSYFLIEEVHKHFPPLDL